MNRPVTRPSGPGNRRASVVPWAMQSSRALASSVLWFFLAVRGCQPKYGPYASKERQKSMSNYLLRFIKYGNARLFSGAVTLCDGPIIYKRKRTQLIATSLSRPIASMETENKMHHLPFFFFFLNLPLFVFLFIFPILSLLPLLFVFALVRLDAHRPFPYPFPLSAIQGVRFSVQ